ncbi:3-hydroxyacyl-CoA dehydrogenase [Chitinophaga alhagiae]|uniref:3-hydroxyacyl-CoA dehydrogenase n=1 Tax=Chitinophaga alhagiae TaxID=2203219 RepID=A0ABM6WCT6_9BACT|nr:3-hydroxyacyl-CoA dehydrogenase family protein [Chitinophaga alhagiae]AWO01696.1 3-hydroxyacyl-CoA dehydrogenase [Chitinophaga alhagiae]
MEILVTGHPQRWEELRNSRSFDGHTVHWEQELQPQRSPADLVIDLSLDEQPENLMLYAMKPEVPVLACLVKTAPAAWAHYPHIYGCNLLPGFISMPRLEVATAAPGKELENIMRQLGWEYDVIQPATGMVTPRVVCMIINEAYFTAEEGTASREDIDTSMKLGTNYPYGPFEWCEKIGIRHVYEVLQAVARENGNERYGISPLLQQEYEAQL